MTNTVETLNIHAVDLGLSVRGAGPAPRRRHSMSDVRRDFLTCCERKQPKSRHVGFTGDDLGLPMPASWKRTAFVQQARASSSAAPLLSREALTAYRLPFLEEAESRLDEQTWVRNDETPWGLMGGRDKLSNNPNDPHFFRVVRGQKIFHNEYRAWLDAARAQDFEGLWKNASMNCYDFVALCLARILHVRPSALETFYNRQCVVEPLPGKSYSYRYNHFGSPFRRKLDKDAFPGDIVFWESAAHGLSHVAILQDVGAKPKIIECSGTHGPEFFGATSEFLASRRGDTVTYVPFELAARTFLAHMNEPPGLYKALSYDAFLRLIPRV